MMAEANFRKLFRLPRDAARDFTLELMPFLHHIKDQQTGIANELRVVTTKSVGKDYNVALSQASVSRCNKIVSSAATENLMRRYINFPTTDVSKNLIKARFYQKH